jgi:transposase, IS30 family
MRDLERVDGHHPGVALTEKRERFIRLVSQGMSNAEASRLVGVNKKTGIRWRFGRTILNRAGDPVHYPPVRTTAHPPRSSRYLSLADRVVIADLRRDGLGVREIASEVGRAPSTVSRELRRNLDEAGRYGPHAAQRKSESRMPRPRPRRVDNDAVFGAAVCELLGRRWSPEQVSHELTVRFADQPQRRLCPESIYQAIYDPDTALTRPAKHSLRSHRRRRRRRAQGLERRGRLTQMTMIDQRPSHVEDREEAGHWEGDLIMGSGNQSAIGTLVERQARFVMLVHLPGEHGADAVREGVTDAFADLPASLRGSLTWDQGREMAQHQQIASATGMGVYFCDAHSPWQRGSNENMNGLLRQYFPKGTDLRAYTAADLAIVADEINHRPRKTLDWATPAGLFDDLLSLTSGVSSAGDGSMPCRVAVVPLQVDNLKAARQLVALT